MDLKCTCPFSRWQKSTAAHEPGCPIGEWISGRSIDQMPAIDALGAEQLARLFHETYERLAPAFGYTTRQESAVPWPEVPAKNQLLMIATAHEVLRQIDQEAGERLAMLVSKSGDKIRIDFQKRLRWFEIDKDHAVNYALTILQHCGVPVNITLNPPPASAENPV